MLHPVSPWGIEVGVQSKTCASGSKQLASRKKINLASENQADRAFVSVGRAI
jgi:hypothetical protein